MSETDQPHLIYWHSVARAIAPLFGKTGKHLEAHLGDHSVTSVLASFDDIVYKSDEQRAKAWNQLLTLVDHLVRCLESTSLSRPIAFTHTIQVIMNAREPKRSCYNDPILRARYRLTIMRMVYFVLNMFKRKSLSRLYSNLCFYILALVTTELPRLQKMVMQAIEELLDEDEDESPSSSINAVDSTPADIERHSHASNSSTKSKSSAGTRRGPRIRGTRQRMVDRMKPDESERYHRVLQLLDDTKRQYDILLGSAPQRMRRSGLGLLSRHDDSASTGDSGTSTPLSDFRSSTSNTPELRQTKSMSAASSRFAAASPSADADIANDAGSAGTLSSDGVPAAGKRKKSSGRSSSVKATDHHSRHGHHGEHPRKHHNLHLLFSTNSEVASNDEEGDASSVAVISTRSMPVDVEEPVMQNNSSAALPGYGLGEVLARDTTCNIIGFNLAGLLAGDHALLSKDPFVDSLLQNMAAVGASPTLLASSQSVSDDDDEVTAENGSVSSRRPGTPVAPNALPPFEKDDEWLRWLRGWSKSYHTFVIQFVEYFCRDDDQVTQLRVSGYSSVLRSFLSWMCVSPHLQWDSVEALAVSVFIQRDKFCFGPFLRTLFENTNALNQMSMMNMFEVLDGWMPYIGLALQRESESLYDRNPLLPVDDLLDLLFDADYFLGVISKLMLEMEHYSPVQQSIVLLYNYWPVFMTDRARHRLYRLVIDEGFLRLFLHWSEDVRMLYMNLIIDRVVAEWCGNDLIASEYRDKALRYIAQVRSASAHSKVSAKGLMVPSKSPNYQSSSTNSTPRSRSGSSSNKNSPRHTPKPTASNKRSGSISSLNRDSPIGSPEAKRKKSKRLLNDDQELIPHAAGTLMVPTDKLPYAAASLEQYELYKKHSIERQGPQRKIKYQDPMALQIMFERM